MVMDPPPTHDSAVLPCFHGCLAFLHRHFPPESPPHIPSVPLSAVNSSPRSGIVPLSLNPSSQTLCLPGDQHSCPRYGCGNYLILIPFRLPQISCFTLSLKCFSSDSDNHPDVGIIPPHSVPPPAEGRPSPNTPVFPPSSFILRVLSDAIYSFLLVRYSCPLSAGVLHALLCLKLCS